MNSKVTNRIMFGFMALGLIFSINQAFAATAPASTSTNTQMSNQTLQLTAVNASDTSSTTSATPIYTTASLNLDPENLFPAPSTAQQQAFQGVAQEAMPLTPDQIVQLKKMLNETQRATAISATVPPKPTVSTQMVNLSPGATPPVVRLQQGFVTSVVFLDSTGAAWPITSYDLGNSAAFDIQVTTGSNAMMIQALKLYTYGNLAVTLQGLSTPVMLTLVPGQQVVDYRMDLQVLGTGPNARTDVAKSISAPNDGDLLSVLDGVPPTGAQMLQVNDSQSQVWIANSKMYLRTRYTVLSPSWESVVSSPDGTKAYMMAESPMVLVSKNGKPIQLKIEGL